MAIFRKIHISFWADPFVLALKQDEKLFYLYLITNQNTSQCGIYEITKRQMSFDLGYSIDKITTLLKYFSDKKKIRYNEQTFELAIKNWQKYNNSTSPKVVSLVNKEIAQVKDRLLVEYLYSIDTVSQPEPEEEPDTEAEIEKTVIADCDLLNWVNENCRSVQKLKEPLTNEEAVKLSTEFKEDVIKKVFTNMQNWNLSKYQSANLTFRNWIKKEPNHLKNQIDKPATAVMPKFNPYA